ncbi:MAG: hypothetical protein QM606_10405 [Leucobacter sp.]
MSEARLQRTDAWKNSDLLLEAVRNVFAPGSKVRTLLILVTILGVAFTAFRVVEISNLERDAQQLAVAGRNVLSVQGKDTSHGIRITRTSCEALVNMPGVIASGALLPGARLNSPQIGFSLPSYVTSLTLVPELRDADLVVGQDLYEGRAGTRFGLAVSDSTKTAIVGSWKPAGLPLNGAIAGAISPNVVEIDHCIVILDQRQSLNSQKAQILAQLEIRNSSPSAQAIVADLSNPYEQFQNRATRYAPLALSVLLSAFVGGIAQSRSNELAAYRLSGTSRLSLVKLLSFETMIVLTTYWCSAILALSVLGFGYHLDFQVSMLADHLTVASGTFVLSAVVLLILTRRSPMELAKDR